METKETLQTISETRGTGLIKTCMKSCCPLKVISNDVVVVIVNVVDTIKHNISNQ